MTSNATSRPGSPWRTALFGALVIMALPWLFMLLDGAGSTSWALVQLTLVNPAVFVIGVLRSWFRYGWKAALVLLVFAAAFLVSVFTVYNDSALIYLAGYATLSSIAVGISAGARVISRRRGPAEN